MKINYGITNSGDFQMRRAVKINGEWTWDTYTVRETGETIARDLVARCKADPALREQWFELLRERSSHREHPRPGMSVERFLLLAAELDQATVEKLLDVEPEHIGDGPDIEPNPSNVPDSAFCDRGAGGCGRRLQLGHRPGCPRSDEPTERCADSVSDAELARAAENAHGVFPGAAASAFMWFTAFQQWRKHISAMVAPVVTVVRGSVALLEAADAPAGELVVQL